MGEEADILVVNDDGFHATGFRFLLRTLSDLGYNLVAVSTSKASSGTGKSLSFSYRVYLTEVESVKTYVIEGGTPATAILHMLYKEGIRPRLVVSGINHGANIGLEDILSSGTIGAVIESALHGIPGVAFSKYLPRWSPDIDIPGTLGNEDAVLVGYLVDTLLKASISCEKTECLAYNVNLPRDEPKELIMATPSFRVYDNISIRYEDGLYKLSSNPQFYANGAEECTDVGSILAGKASITSISWLYSSILGDCRGSDILVKELILNEPPPPSISILDCWGTREWATTV